MKYDFDLQLDDRNSLSLIAKQVEEGSVVLEFGPANGRLTKYLKEKKNCRVYAVEIDEEAAKDSSCFTEDIIVDDIEKFEWLERWAKIEFDYILFADVLEHLRNPLKVLKQTKALLKEDGRVILSVPNVAHNSILINLHRNIFSYTPVGLLDDTHIHLFSYYSLKEMCGYAGYTPVVEDAIYANVGDVEIKNSYSDVDRDLENILRHRKYGNVYQFYFTLQKTSWIQNFDYTTDYRIRTAVPGYRFQIFVDRGEGWLEENSITAAIIGVGDFSFKTCLKNYQEVKCIRVDVFDKNGIIKNFSLDITDGEITKSYSAADCGTNGEYNKYRDEILFANDDPQMIITDLPQSSLNDLILEVSFSCIDINIPSYRLERIREMFSEIKSANEELERRLTELEHRMDVINELRQENDSINNLLKKANEKLQKRKFR